MPSLRDIYLTTLILFSSTAAVATAATKNWTDGTGNWNVGSNWNGGTVPASGDLVNIVFTDGVARTVTYNVAAPTLGLISVDLTGAGTAASTLSLPNGFNLTSAAISVGGYNGASQTNGRGAMNQA